MRRFGTQWKEMQTVARYILQRLGQTLLILLIVSFITINEQIPKGNQKDRDISSLWW